MKNPFTLIFTASKLVLAERRSYQWWFVALTLLFIDFYIFVPIWLTPGNSVSFQLSLFTVWDYALFAALSAVTALLILMRTFIFLRVKKNMAGAIGQSTVGTVSALFGGILASATCPSCVAAIIGFLGAGSVLFIFEYQPYIVALTFAFVAAALYISARRVHGHCKQCDVSK